jgi:type IV pilus assembly protein PilW
VSRRPALHRQTSRQRARRAAPRGFTLIELLISVTLGLVILAASMQVFTSSSRGSRTAQLETQLNEDGILALDLIQQQLQQAGYAQQIIPAAGATVMGNYAGPAVRGCDGGFVNTGAAFDNLACAPGSDNAAIAIRYQASNDNTIPTTAKLPTNCVGSGINADAPSQAAPAPTPAPPAYTLADNRYYVKSASALGLSCRGSEKNGDGAPNVIGGEQPLLANVERMQILYGIASRPSAELARAYDPLKHQVIAYLSAAEIDALPVTGTLPNATDDRWGRVLSVRVCLLMRSDQPVPDAPAGAPHYSTCDNRDAASADHYLRRAFTTTALLRNRLVVNF